MCAAVLALACVPAVGRAAEDGVKGVTDAAHNTKFGLPLAPFILGVILGGADTRCIIRSE